MPSRNKTMSVANTNTIKTEENGDNTKEIYIQELKEKIFSLKEEIAEKNIVI